MGDRQIQVGTMVGFLRPTQALLVAPQAKLRLVLQELQELLDLARIKT